MLKILNTKFFFVSIDLSNVLQPKLPKTFLSTSSKMVVVLATSWYITSDEVDVTNN